MVVKKKGTDDKVSKEITAFAQDDTATALAVEQALTDKPSIAVETDETIVKQKSSQRLVYRIVKRAFDFLIALVAGIVLLIPMAVIAVMIMIKDPGNPFYSQERVGPGGKPIRMVKFRSMRKGSSDLESILTSEQIEEYKKEYKLEDDPRLIGYIKPGDGKKCFGGKLRRTSIDELPQILWNICIRGNMSLVGPRPILFSELEENYTKEEQELFLSAKPGLTGYWQAYARNDVGYSNHERQEMELYYCENRSLWLDIKIIFKTFGAVILGKGAI